VVVVAIYPHAGQPVSPIARQLRAVLAVALTFGLAASLAVDGA
jgi:hypothetical protein